MSALATVILSRYEANLFTEIILLVHQFEVFVLNMFKNKIVLAVAIFTVVVVWLL